MPVSWCLLLSCQALFLAASSDELISRHSDDERSKTLGWSALTDGSLQSDTSHITDGNVLTSVSNIFLKNPHRGSNGFPYFKEVRNIRTRRAINTNKTYLRQNSSTEVARDVRILDLDENGLMELTNSTLRITGRPNDLLTVEQGPMHGRILVRGEEVRQFSISDISSQVVVYAHDGKETGQSVVQDHFRLVSKNHQLNVEVNIHPIDDASPRMRLEGVLRVKEGGKAKLTNRQIRIEDPDTRDQDITCHIIAQPMFGHVRVADRPSNTFDYAQIKNGQVYYIQTVHEGLEPKEDGLSVACYDTENNTETGNNFGLVNISIDGINDEPPTIRPKVLLVPRGGEVCLSKDLIVPKDPDTPLERLTFLLETPPTKGVVMKKVDSMEYQGVKNFSFSEMKDVYYRSGTESGEDTFTLCVSDGAHFSKNNVRVSIQKEETTPQLLINEGLELQEGTTADITAKILYAEDGDTSAEKIQYVLRDTPLFGTLLMDGVELSPGSRFTQSIVASSRLAYRHSDSSSSMDVFVFDLTDGKNTLTNQNFFITILSRNQSYPVVTSETAVISPLSTLVFTTDIFKLKNAESEDVEFHVMSPPRHGRLEWRGKTEPLHSFMYSDVEEGSVQYVHLTNKTLPEIIQFEVSDGQNSVFHTFNINFTTEHSHNQILSAEALVSEEATEETVTSRPTVLANNPVLSLKEFEDGSLGAVIGKRNLYAEDDGKNITYIIADPPKYGQLFNQRTNNSCGNFTQDDVNSGRLRYILKPGMRVAGDTVLLNVLGQGLPLKGLQFTLEWSWVHFKTNRTLVRETEGAVKIQLERWGSLTESAFVGIRISGKNASVPQDFTVVEEQVQFSPGQSTAFLNINIQDDFIFEGPETAVVSLADPYSLLIADVRSTTVVITDWEDEPKYSFKNLKYVVFENASEVILPIMRSGDTSSDVNLECVTENGEAEGGSKLDFSPQPGIPSAVKFAKGDSESFCSVTIYDDDIMEPEEDFWVKLKTGPKELASTHVSILPDEKDYPTVSFTSGTLIVHETDGEVKIDVVVDGVREIVNASVAVVASSISARANKDYIFHKSVLTIKPNEDKFQVIVQILDDNKAKMYEGNETFLLSLVEPKNCLVGESESLLIVIEDESDVPVLQFTRTDYTVSESSGKISLEIERQGDTMGEYHVICFVNEKTATFFDYTFGAPNATYQVIYFLPGEIRKNCTITLHDDHIYESREYFTVHLKPDNRNIKIGGNNKALVTVTDEEDREIIFFRKTHYFTKEPGSPGQNGSVSVEVNREGDSKHSTQVRIYTKDGTARSGEDYLGKSTVMKFEPEQTTFTCEIQILYDKVVEIKEYFTIHLEVLNNGDTLYSRKSIIYIYDSPHPGSTMFPAAPVIYSPNRFEDSSSEKNFVIQGVSLVCLSVCDEGHHLSKKFSNWCKKHNLKSSNTKYKWQIEDRGGKPVDIANPAFFSNTSRRSLESVYVRGGFRLRCGVSPVLDGGSGKTSYSEFAAVSRAPGACPPPSENMIGAEPFIAQISYTEDDKSKLIKVSVAIPHYDGMFPAISTHPIGDAFQILESYTPRSEIHKCSNIIKESEMQTKYGFYRKAGNELTTTYNTDLQSLRGKDAVNLYRHLDLESCVWNFEAYFTLDEAVNLCGAAVKSESNLFDTERTSVTLELPLYVTYYTYSTFGWQHTDTSIVLRLTFLYEGSVLSDEGVVREEEEHLEGLLHPTSMHISGNGSLVVFFRTTPKFPGYFLIFSNEGFQSYVHSVERPEMPITLKLLNNKTYSSDMEQYWVFQSEFSSDDYTGRYEVSLVPCVFVDSIEVCTARQNIIFPLDVHLQQISDPVLKKYTLNTSFHLIKKRDTKNAVEESSLFEPGDEVYGFIKMVPPQSHFELEIDQCYVCSGRNGRTPRYNPKRKEFGCLTESPDLQYSVKIIDRYTPSSEQSSHPEINLNGSLVEKSENITSILDARNVDIFHFDITPLFRLKSAKVWFVHCTFTIKSSHRLGKRSLEERRKGTNMRRMVLRQPQEIASRPLGRSAEPAGRPRQIAEFTHEQLHLFWLASVLIVLALSLLLTIVLLCYILHFKKELAAKKNTTYANVNYRECLTHDTSR